MSFPPCTKCELSKQSKDLPERKGSDAFTIMAATGGQYRRAGPGRAGPSAKLSTMSKMPSGISGMFLRLGKASGSAVMIRTNAPLRPATRKSTPSGQAVPIMSPVQEPGDQAEQAGARAHPAGPADRPRPQHHFAPIISLGRALSYVPALLRRWLAPPALARLRPFGRALVDQLRRLLEGQILWLKSISGGSPGLVPSVT